LARLSDATIGLWLIALEHLSSHRSGRLPKKRNSYRESQYMLGRSKVRSGDYSKAMQLFASVTESEPVLADALEAYGEILDMSGHGHLASIKFDAYRTLQAQTNHKAADRPLFLRRSGRLTAEVAAYSEAILFDKDKALLYIALGNTCLAQGTPEKALMAYTYAYALGLGPKDPNIAACRAEALLALGRYAEALSAFDIALANNPKHIYALSGRAMALLALGEIAKADADWRLQLSLLAPEQVFARACVAMRTADYAAALPDLEGAIRREPRNAYWHLYLRTASKRLAHPVTFDCAPANDAWPAALISLHDGNMSVEDVLRQAYSPEQTAEALFQLGILALPRDPAEARDHWRQVVTRSAPTQIEHAAACHELALLES